MLEALQMSALAALSRDHGALRARNRRLIQSLLS